MAMAMSGVDLLKARSRYYMVYCSVTAMMESFNEKMEELGFNSEEEGSYPPKAEKLYTLMTNTADDYLKRYWEVREKCAFASRYGTPDEVIKKYESRYLAFK